jgi:methylated-DNA-[protein]-cysteine S-methyltransferase
VTKFVVFPTAFGPCAIAWSDAGIVRLQLPQRTEAETRARMSEHAEARPPAWVKDAILRVQRHLEGDAQDLTPLRLDLSRVPAFHAKVLEALRGVPAKETVTYADLARRAGSPRALRAVGQAMAKNPIPVIVPCHRVLAAGDRPGGFSAYGGTFTKAKLLAVEGVTLGSAGRIRPQATGGDDAPLFAAHDALALPYDADEATRHLATRDAKLAALMEKAGPFRLRLKQTDGAFAALAESIVYQQLNGKAAATILGRVKALFPSRVFFTPKDILSARDADLRGAGLSRSKLLALRDLATKAEQGIVPTLPALGAMTDDAIVDHLTQVRGIGRWTVEMLLMFRLGRPDVLPVSDYGVRQGFKLTFRTRELPSPAQMLRRAEAWRPFRSVASWYMWRAVDLARKNAP